MDLSAPEIRVLGCLIEKQRTTPDQYPLTLNALRTACNQTTNRDPVVHYDEATIREALAPLARQRLVRLASGHSSRATKYRHLLSETLSLADDELSLLAVLMLRGPQTPGELKQRTERLYRLADLDAVEDVVDRLAARGYAERMERKPGQKEARYRHLLGAGGEAGAGPGIASAPLASEPPAVATPPAPVRADGELADRVARLEREVEALRVQLQELRGGAPATEPAG